MSITAAFKDSHGRAFMAPIIQTTQDTDRVTSIKCAKIDDKSSLVGDFEDIVLEIPFDAIFWLYNQVNNAVDLRAPEQLEEDFSNREGVFAVYFGNDID